MSFRYNKLRGRIVEKFGKLETFAKAMEWSRPTLSYHLCGISEWKQSEMCKALNLLELDISEIKEYFFDYDVQDIEQEEASN